MTSQSDRESDLVRRTLRTVGLLVAACVLFVGMLSIAAVAIASRAVHAGPSAANAADAPSSAAKKPISI
jgi:hypothetical protein